MHSAETGSGFPSQLVPNYTKLRLLTDMSGGSNLLYTQQPTWLQHTPPLCSNVHLIPCISNHSEWTKQGFALSCKRFRCALCTTSQLPPVLLKHSTSLGAHREKGGNSHPSGALWSSQESSRKQRSLQAPGHIAGTARNCQAALHHQSPLGFHDEKCSLWPTSSNGHRKPGVKGSISADIKCYLTPLHHLRRFHTREGID